MREARTARGYSLNQLADAVECTKSQIVAYEAGRCAPEPLRLVALADLLHLKPLQLMGVAESNATLADLRAAAGHTAETAAHALGISRNSYRPMECQGRFPHARELYVRELALLYDVPRSAIRSAILRIPAVVERRARMTALVVDEVKDLLRAENRAAVLSDVDVLDELTTLAEQPREQVRRLVDFLLDRGRDYVLASENAKTRSRFAQNAVDREKAQNLVQHYETRLKRWPDRLVRSLEWLPDALNSREWKSLIRLARYEHINPPGMLWSDDPDVSAPFVYRLLPVCPGLVQQRARVDRAVQIDPGPTGVRARLTAWGARYGCLSEPLYQALYPQIQAASGIFDTQPYRRQLAAIS
ncbi:MAG: XRE family transcriptional regulator [Streptomycetaceae bacterium]|nr:XRE family transcriptional regulator [Streptomycetaceae bacterium]